MSGIFDSSIDSIDSSIAVTPVTGSIFQITGSVLSTILNTSLNVNQSLSGSTPWRVELYNNLGLITSSNPLFITGSVTITNPQTQSVNVINNSLNVTQGLSGSIPWKILGTVDQGLSGSIPWKITGSVLVTQNTNPWITQEKEKATFVTQVTGTAIAQNKSMISILNATTSSAVIKIQEIKIINAQTTDNTGVTAEFRFLRTTGHSAGTLMNILTFDTNDVVDSNVTVRTGATITGEAVVPFFTYRWSSDDFTVTGLDADDAEVREHALQNLIPIYKTSINLKPITLRSNQGLTIKQITNSTAGTFNIIIVFSQE